MHYHPAEAVIRRTTYVLKFFRNHRLLDVEIHPDWDSCAMQAVGYVNCFSTSRDATGFEHLIQEWDSEIGPMTWSDGEYEILLDSQDARHLPREDNQCTIIPFRRSAA